MIHSGKNTPNPVTKFQLELDLWLMSLSIYSEFMIRSVYVPWNILCELDGKL